MAVLAPGDLPLEFLRPGDLDGTLCLGGPDGLGGNLGPTFCAYSWGDLLLLKGGEDLGLCTGEIEGMLKWSSSAGTGDDVLGGGLVMGDLKCSFSFLSFCSSCRSFTATLWLRSMRSLRS